LFSSDIRRVNRLTDINKTRIWQAVNTSDVRIDKKIPIYQAANTSDISIENKTHISILISDVLAT
jgi:hypothetical protein